MDFRFKRIADPVHGTIGLSKLEVQLIHCRAYQRLRNIKQLGLAHFVFPAADYSRFAHSIGVCHVTGRLIEALQHYGLFPEGEAERETQRYRLAALCHDLGHYPFSHAMEVAVKNHYSATLLKASGEGSSEDSLHHEEVSELVIQTDLEIAKVLADGGFNAEEVTGIFRRRDPPPFANLISSDLDADRIDYLLRTAHHTGLPYGNVDLDYLVSQMRLDDQRRLAVTAQAMRSAEHLLLCRFFDYQQVSYHKTVAALELVLKDVLMMLLDRGMLQCSAGDIAEQIANGAWADFDDGKVLSLVAQLADDSAADQVVRLKAQGLLQRNVPKLCGEVEYFARRSDLGEFSKRLEAVKKERTAWAATAGLPPEFVYVWEQKVTVTKAGTNIPFAADVEEEEDKLEQAVRVLPRNGSTSRPIVQCENSLMHAMADQMLFGIRVYALVPPNLPQARKKFSDAIAASNLNDLLPWK